MFLVSTRGGRTVTGEFPPERALQKPMDGRNAADPCLTASPYMLCHRKLFEGPEHIPLSNPAPFLKCSLKKNIFYCIIFEISFTHCKIHVF